MQPWPADQYKIGAYIQHHFSEHALSAQRFQFRNNDILLDLGCGDGGFTANLAKKIPDGRVEGWDPDANMIALAKKLHATTSNLIFEQHAAEDLEGVEADLYSVVTAFWSFQWMTDHEKVLRGVHHTLKPGGRFFAIFPSSQCLHMRLYETVKASKKFPELNDFLPTAHFPTMEDCQRYGKLLGFKSLQAVLMHQKVKLPDIDTFKKFIQGIPFFVGQVPDKIIPRINDAMVSAFEEFCKESFNGELFFSDEMIVFVGIKAPNIIALSPDQRELLIKAQEPRGDLTTPRSQLPETLGDHAHFDSIIKPHDKFADRPRGDDAHLSQQTANNPVADQRAEQAPELTPSPSAKLQAQAVLSAKPEIVPKPIPGK